MLVAALAACTTSPDPQVTLDRTDPSTTTATVITVTPGTTASEAGAEVTGGTTGWRDRISDTCAVLRTEGYETRKAALLELERAAGDDAATARDAVRDECSAAAARLADAVEVEARRDELDRGEAPVEISGLQCADGTYQFVATNRVDHPIGVHAGFRIFVGDGEVPVSSADYPIVIWRLEPGQRQGITGDFTVPDTDDGYRCNVTARVFDATDDDADAGLPGVTDAALTGDEPENWFGALLGREVDGVGSGDVDAAAVTEDLRSTFYDNVLAANTGDEPADRIPTSVTICRDSVARPDVDHLSFVYFVTYPTGDGGEEGLLRHGLFRRGSDDQWRWLSAAQYFDSPDFWSCGKPGPID